MPAHSGRHTGAGSARVEPGLARQGYQRCGDVRLGLAHGGEQARVVGDRPVAVRVGVTGVALEANARRISSSASPI